MWTRRGSHPFEDGEGKEGDTPGRPAGTYCMRLSLPRNDVVQVEITVRVVDPQGERADADGWDLMGSDGWAR